MKTLVVAIVAILVLAGGGLYFFTDSSSEASDISVEATFEHVKPGEYSEIRQTVRGLKPGTYVTGTLNGPGKFDAPTDTFADENGTAVLVWKITSYGEYLAKADADVEGEIGVSKTLRVHVK